MEEPQPYSRFQSNERFAATIKRFTQSSSVKETKIFPAYLKVEVSFSLEKLDIKRVYRIYDDCPAIACDTYLRGNR